MASAPRTSPTIILSGLILKEVRIKSRILISPSPSRFALRDSNLTRLGKFVICNSALSSIGITHHKTYACYNCLENSVFTRNTDIFYIRKAPYISRVLTIFMFILCFMLSYSIIRLVHSLLHASFLPMHEYMCLM